MPSRTACSVIALQPRQQSASRCNASRTLAASTELTGAGGLVKRGLGRLELSGRNTYAGGTAVIGGTLALNGSVTSAVSVGQQGTLRGTGSIETDWLNGEIVLLGRLHGVPTPANAFLTALGARLAREGLRPGAVTPEEIAQGYAAAEAGG